MPATTKGLIIGLALGLISIVMQLTIKDITKMQSLSFVTYAVIVGGVVWACYKYGQDMQGRVTFGNVFAHGFQTTAVMTIIGLVFTVLMLYVLFPDMQEKLLELARADMEKQGKMSETDIDNAMEMTRKMFTPFLIAGSVIGNLILGAIGALIGAGIAKKGAPAEPFN